MKLCPKCGEKLKENTFHERYCRNGCEIVTAAIRGQRCFTEALIGDLDKPYSGSFGQAIRRFPTNRE